MKSINSITSQVRVLPALVAAAWLLQAGVAHAEADTFGTGTGRSGDLSVGSANTLVNTYAPLSSDVAAGTRSLTVGARTGAGTTFAVGDMVMVWQVTGLSQSDAPSGSGTALDLSAIAGGAVGRYEFARVKAFDGTTLTLTKDLLYPYTGGRTQIVSVPEYTSVSIAAAGSVTAPAWNGAVGGVVAFVATGAISNAGSIAVLGKGFRGGILQNYASPTGCTGLDGISTANGGAHKGEGPVVGVYTTSTGVTLTNGYGNRATGGGGGNCHNAGGGGGGNRGPGGKGGSTYSTSQPYGGGGGSAQVFSLADHLSFGGGGGAGEENNNVGTPGGAGGGVIFVRAASSTGGTYNANGVSQAGTGQNDGQGGGGAGGTVLLALTGTLDCAGVSATGGAGGNVGASHGAGGGGGGGYVVTNSSAGTCTGSSGNGAGGTGGNGGTGGTTGTTDPEPPIVVVPCDFASGTCGGCTGAADCATLTGVPFCRAADARCVSCLADSDCGGGTQWCDIAVGACKAQLSNGSAIPTDTGHTSPVLDGTCSGPAASLTCSSGVCDARDNQCGYGNAGASACTAANAGAVCRSSACSPGANVCVPAGGCAADADCNTAAEWCNISTLSCVQKSANGNNLPSDSAHGTPVLDGSCSGAAATLTCASGVCDTRDNQCGYGNGAGSACSAANAAEVCRTGLCSVAGTCLAPAACAADGDCAGGWCNIAASTCFGKAPNGDAMTADPGHTSPVLDGSCSGAAATLTCASGVCDTRDNQCGYGNGAGSACSAANAAVVCRTGLCSAAGTCLAPAACAADGDCVGGWCNLSASMCSGKAANGDVMTADPGHTSPVLDGTCSAPAATLICASGVCDSTDNHCGLADGTAGCTAANAAQVCRTGNCKASGLCGNDPVVADAGEGTSDAATSDAGAPRSDASVPVTDAGASRADASTPLADAGGGGGGNGGATGSTDSGTGTSGATGGDRASADSGGCSTQGGSSSTSMWALLSVAALGLIKRRRAA